VEKKSQQEPRIKGWPQQIQQYFTNSHSSLAILVSKFKDGSQEAA